VLSRFQDYIINFDKNEVNEFLSKPMLMVKLWTHQEEALDAWFQNDKQGIIEMATATGKTVVGLSAIIKLYNDSLKLNQKDPNYKKLNVLVLTHSKAILNQWRREVIEKLGLSGNPTDSYTKPIDYNG
jgi:superfamily II DNA or RNA helicase